MARIKNSAPAGSPPRDVGKDAPVFRRWLYNSIGDAALASDKMTGANAEANTINHSGNGRGCPMMLPPVSTVCDISLTNTGTATPYYVWGAPIYIPPGESTDALYAVEIDLLRRGSLQDFSVEVRNSTTWAVIQAGSLVERIVTRTFDEQTNYVTNRLLVNLAPGWQVLLIVATPPASNDASRLRGVRVYGVRETTGQNNGLSMSAPSATGNPYPVPSTLSSSLLDVQDTQVEDNGPLDAYVLTRLNRGMGALWEYVTGAKVPGNATRTMPTTVDNNTAPAPSLAMPMGSWGTSAVRVDGTVKTATGLTGFARYPTAEFATTTISQVRLQFPDFLFATNPLKCRVIVWQKAGVATNWRFNTSTAAGSSSVVAVTMIGATEFGYVEIADGNYTSGQAQTLSLQASHASPGVFSDEIYVVGWSVAFDP